MLPFSQNGLNRSAPAVTGSARHDLLGGGRSTTAARRTTRPARSA